MRSNTLRKGNTCTGKVPDACQLMAELRQKNETMGGKKRGRTKPNVWKTEKWVEPAKIPDKDVPYLDYYQASTSFNNR